MAKLNVNRVSIWIESGKPRCSPGSIEAVLPVVRESIRQADEWIDAAESVARTNEVHRERSPEDEKYIRETIKKTGCDRGQALLALKTSGDIADL